MIENRIHLKLYVALGSPNSLMAVHNITEILERYLPDRYQLDVIDLFEEPLRALEDGVMMTPTLLLASSAPQIRIIGNLSDPAPVLQALKLIPE